MKRLYLSLSLLFFCFTAFSQILITEIMYNPPESGTDSLEFIEIYNAGEQPVDLDGYYFTAGVEDTVSGVELGAGEYYVFAVNAQAMMNVFGIQADQWSDGGLNNGGELIAFADPQGNVVDMVEYDDGGDWPTEPDGDGPSLELISLELDNSLPESWQASFTSTGIIIESNEVMATPGAANSTGSGGPDATIACMNLKFIPDFALVEKGETVLWVNNESIAHNVNGQQSTYPDNPASFFSGVASPGPWEFPFIFNVEGYYDYQCDPHLGVGMVGVIAAFDPDGYTPFSFGQIRRHQDENVITEFDGVPTVLTGVVHGVNFQGGGLSFYLINEQNEGINVFSFDPVSDYTVTEGDELRVRGEVDQYRGLIELIPDNIEVLSTGNALVTPVEITEMSEEYEGSMVMVSGVTLDSIQGTGGSGDNVFASRDGNVFVIRIDSDTDINVGALSIGSTYNITGIGNQFDNDAPYDSGYQILVRYNSDFENLSSVERLDQMRISMFPNPVVDQLTFAADLPLEKVSIINQNGQVVRWTDQPIGNTLRVDDLSAGMYFMRVETSEGVWVSHFVKH